LGGNGLPGYLIIGIDEKDGDFRLPITDDLMQQFAAYRSDGQVMPLPVMRVEKVDHPGGGGEVLVVEVKPHDMPPVRFRGRVHVRVGPRKDTASEAEERVLMERRAANFPTFDAAPCPEGLLDRLDLETFRQTYRPAAIAEEVIAENHRDLKAAQIFFCNFAQGLLLKVSFGFCSWD
jgi:ATP-dependent DNA helicase RecG